MTTKPLITRGLASHIDFWLEAIAEAMRQNPQTFRWHVEGRNSVWRDAEGRCPVCALCHTLAQERGEVCRFKGSFTLAVREEFGEIGSVDHDALHTIAYWADHKSSLGFPLIKSATEGVFVPVPENLIDRYHPLRA